MEIVELWTRLVTSEGPARYAAAVAVAALGAAVGELMVRLALRMLAALARRTSTTYDDHVVTRLRVPVRMLVGVIAVHLGLLVLDHPTLAGVAVVGEWLLCIFIAVETLETLLVDYFLEDRLNVRIPPVVRQVVIGVVYLGAALALLGHVFGIDVTPLLATTSVASLILGLALQAPLSNLFSGLVVHLDRSVSEGDWIQIGAREGRVIHLGWRSTRLHTLSDDVLIIPNNLLMTSEIQNFTAPAQRTARNVEIPVPYDVAPDDVLRWVREELARIPRVLAEPPPKAWLTRFEPGFQRYVLKFWVEDFGFHDDLESDVLKALWHRFRKEGAPLQHPMPVRVEGREEMKGR